jgi:hypothetical protein
MSAARNGSLHLVKEWLRTGLVDEIEQGDRSDCWTLLHAASAADQKAVVEFLLSKGASVNAVTRQGQSALHLAALDSHQDICKLLLQHSCNPLLRTSPKLGSRTARDFALLFDRQPIAALLEQAENDFLGGMQQNSGGVVSSARPRLADFSKWSKMDWGALERESDHNLSVPTARMPQAVAPAFASASASAPSSASVVEEAAFSYSSDPNRLLSFRPPPEGGSPPNANDGGSGPRLPLLQGGGDGGVCYTWSQTLRTLNVAIDIGMGIAAKDIKIHFAPNSISVTLPSALPCACAWIASPQQLWSSVFPEDCTWSLDSQGLLEILLCKQQPSYWRCVVVGHPMIDSSLCRGPDVLSQLDDDKSKSDAMNMFSKMLAKLQS